MSSAPLPSPKTILMHQIVSASVEEMMMVMMVIVVMVEGSEWRLSSLFCSLLLCMAGNSRGKKKGETGAL